MTPSFSRSALLLVAAIAVCLAVSCTSAPASKPTAEDASIQEPAPEQLEPGPLPPKAEAPQESPSFDPSTVTAEVKTATFVDVRALIESLNQIIRRQDYEAWLSHLSDEYIAFYSNPAVLAKYSEYPIMKRKGIKLQTLRDYFINVVYPSRQNDKVDDIEFVRGDMIKAITVSPKGDRNILYMLEKHGEAWKIGIGR